MQLSRAKKRTGFMGLTPLIDMIFLLLLFFLLGSDFVQFANNQIAPPRGAGGAQNAATPIIVTLSPDGAIGWNGTLLHGASHSHANETWQLSQRARSTLRANSAINFVVMPSGAASIQQVTHIMDALAGAGAQRITLEADLFDIDLANF